MAVLLGGLSVYLNKDWFARDNIQIYDRSRPVRGGMLGRKRVENSAVNPVVFGFNKKLPLKSVKVVSVSEIETNKFPHPVWYLISESNSVPTKDFLYGMNIQGMHPAVKETTADPLEPDVKYRLFIESGPIKAQHDFVPVPRLN